MTLHIWSVKCIPHICAWNSILMTFFDLLITTCNSWDWPGESWEECWWVIDVKIWLLVHMTGLDCGYISQNNYHYVWWWSPMLEISISTIKVCKKIVWSWLDCKSSLLFFFFLGFPFFGSWLVSFSVLQLQSLIFQIGP